MPILIQYFTVMAGVDMTDWSTFVMRSIFASTTGISICTNSCSKCSVKTPCQCLDPKNISENALFFQRYLIDFDKTGYIDKRRYTLFITYNPRLCRRLVEKVKPPAVPGDTYFLIFSYTYRLVLGRVYKLTKRARQP